MALPTFTPRMNATAPILPAVASTADGPIDLTKGPVTPVGYWLSNLCDLQITKLCTQLGTAADPNTGGAADQWNWQGAGDGCQVGYWLPGAALPNLPLVAGSCDATLRTMVRVAVSNRDYNRLSVNIDVGNPEGFPVSAEMTGVQVNAGAISYIMQG